MAYARVEKTVAMWRGRSARFVRQQLGRDWYLDIGPNGYVTIAEAAALLGVHEDTVRGWIERGEVEFKTYDDDGSHTIVLWLTLVRDVYRELHGKYP
jgi:excisionase family DNA binding protein